MTTVVQAFDLFFQKIELTEAERKTAADQQNNVRDKLREQLGTQTQDFLAGSYSRRTAIRPLNDIDMFFVLDPVAHADCYPGSQGGTPAACLRKIRRALKEAFPAHDPKVQGHSVHIDFTGSGIGYDVVPAFAEKSGGEYKIPDRDRDEWIRTNPKKHQEVCTSANARAGDKLNRLIKAAKHWSYRQPDKSRLRSFHLEVMSYGAFATGPDSFPEGLAALFGFLAERVQRTCADPAGIGPNIDAAMAQSERTAARSALLAAAGTAAQALVLDKAGRTAQAHTLWHGLLGDPYPVK